MQLQDILYSQGFGTRRVCAGLAQQGWVEILSSAEVGAPVACTDATQEFNPEGLRFRVQGVEWLYQAKAYLMLHKPAGVECSQKPSAYPSIYTLLPSPLRQRPSKSAVQGVQAVGRLDQDTTGLLLLSDDGQFIHRMSSPKKHVPKIYRVHAKHEVTAQQVERLLAGVVLDDGVKTKPCVIHVVVDEPGRSVLEITLHEGRNRQIRRMCSAVGLQVVRLRRTAEGPVKLGMLQPGEYRELKKSEINALRNAAQHKSRSSEAPTRTVPLRPGPLRPRKEQG